MSRQLSYSRPVFFFNVNSDRLKLVGPIDLVALLKAGAFLLAPAPVVSGDARLGSLCLWCQTSRSDSQGPARLAVSAILQLEVVAGQALILMTTASHHKELSVSFVCFCSCFICMSFVGLPVPGGPLRSAPVAVKLYIVSPQ